MPEDDRHETPEGAAIIQVTPAQIVGAAAFLIFAGVLIFIAGMLAQGLTSASKSAEKQAVATPESDFGDLSVSDLAAPDPEPVPEVIEEQAEPEPPAEPPEPVRETAMQEREVEPVPIEPGSDPADEPDTIVTAPAVIEDEEVMDHNSEPEPTPEPEVEQPAATVVQPAIADPVPDEPELTEQAAPPPAASTSDGAGLFTVQVVSFKTERAAQATEYQIEVLEEKQLRVELLNSSDGKWIRAVIGSYETREAAEVARKELVAAGFKDCFVQRRDR